MRTAAETKDPQEEETTGMTETAKQEDPAVREIPRDRKETTKGVMNNVTSKESKVQKTAERPHDR